ncbi:hypothetical protein R83H12_02777 [Fibrobacteria bacterium R8-3-H12]
MVAYNIKMNASESHSLFQRIVEEFLCEIPVAVANAANLLIHSFDLPIGFLLHGGKFLAVNGKTGN